MCECINFGNNLVNLVYFLCGRHFVFGHRIAWRVVADTNTLGYDNLKVILGTLWYCKYLHR